MQIFDTPTTEKTIDNYSQNAPVCLFVFFFFSSWSCVFVNWIESYTLTKWQAN